MNRIKTLATKAAWLTSGWLLFISAVAGAQNVEFAGNIRAGVSNTDNVFLQPQPDTLDENIYQVRPALNLVYSNQRVDVNAGYEFDWYRYSDLKTTNNYHRYDAQLTGKLIPDTLFLTVGGVRSQSLIDPDQVIPSGGLPISNNLADRDEYYVEPSFRQTFGRAITVNARYRLAEVAFDDSDFGASQFAQDNTNQTASFKIDNYQRGRGLTWAIGYDWQEAEYDVSLPFENRRATGELGLWVNSKARLFASGGKESAWDDPFDASLEDDFWEAGFAYKSGDTLEAEFAAGKRSFGSSWRGEVDFSFRRGRLEFSYSESPTTMGFNRFSRGNLPDGTDFDDLLARPGSAERFIQERGRVTLGLELRRTDVALTVFDDKRSQRTQADGTPLGEESQSGVSLDVAWQAGARTEFTAGASLSSRESETQAEWDFITASLGVNYKVGQRVALTLGYDYSEQDPKREGSSRDYVANVTSFFVTYTF